MKQYFKIVTMLSVILVGTIAASITNPYWGDELAIWYLFGFLLGTALTYILFKRTVDE